MRKIMKLVEAALTGEIIPPEKPGGWGGSNITTDDPKHDRSWEQHPDAPLMPIWEYGEQVSYDEFMEYLKRNADRLGMHGYDGQTDAVGVTDTRRSWEDENRITRAFYTSGYQDTEYWIDPQWGKGIDASPDVPRIG